MSGPPVRPRSRELEIVRVLFDKHLLERAVNLAEARWDGSGEVVRLAYHWQDLNPAERREELERIGPEQLSRFRTLADLEPELAAVLDTLEQRGVLPADPGGMADDAGEDFMAAAEPASVAESPTPSPAPAAVPTVNVEPAKPITVNQGDSDNLAAGLAATAAGAAATVVGRTPLPIIDREEIAQAEQARRADALRSGEELLQRVRSRLDSTARRVTSNPIGSGTAAPTLPAQIPAHMPGRLAASGVTVADAEDVFSPPPEYWLERLANERVVSVEPGTNAPTDDQLIGLANEFGLDLHEFVIEPGSVRELFGSLRRSGACVDVRIGPLPSALQTPSLVVVRGRLFPRQEARLRQGICDIPGTRKSVALDERARVLLIA